MSAKSATLLIVLFFSVNLLAQIPSLPDSAKSEPPKDSTIVLDTARTDSLYPEDITEAEKRVLNLQDRLEKFKESEKPAPRLSYYDSLMTYVMSERFNYRAKIDRSFFHDAGDYFKFNPAYFVVDYQSMPMRKTVQPFGLTGDRINIINGGVPFTPFEHIVEPDGLIDFNDVPTALDGPVYIIPGPAGQLFGGDRTLATLLTSSNTADSNQPASGFMADRGYFGYAFVRGRYAREFSNGRRVELSAGSRKTDGQAFGREDEQLHYTAGGYFPMGTRFGINLDAKMYDRDAAFVVRPDSIGSLLDRHRFDRSFLVAVEHQDKRHTRRTEIGYRHLRQGSFIDNIYTGRFNYTVNGVLLTHERMVGLKILRSELISDFNDFDNGYSEYHRFNASVNFYVASLRKVNNLSMSVRTTYSEDFDFLPAVTILYKSEIERFFIQMSVAYAQSEPTQHQLYLPFQQASLFGSTSKEYSESGNANLKKEAQLIGSLTVEPGTIDNHFNLSITGGKITDAIEWSMQRQSGTPEILHFSPVNDDITFMTVSAGPEFKLKDLIRFNGGVAYHYYNYDSLGDRPYQPEYNYFGGMELHYYWADRLIDLFAYGELVYTGPYKDYDQQSLGKELIANAKLSLGLKNFRFHFVFQNTLENEYQAREQMTIPGRFFYYGLTWNFFD